MKLIRTLLLTLFLLSTSGMDKAIARDYFVRYNDAGLPGHNYRVLKGVGVSRGRQECLSDRNCRSFDVRKSDGTVYLQDVNQSDRGVGGLRFDYPGNPYDHYERRYHRN